MTSSRSLVPLSLEAIEQAPPRREGPRRSGALVARRGGVAVVAGKCIRGGIAQPDHRGLAGRTGLTVSLTCVATTNTAVMAIVAVINRSAASWSIPRHDTGAEMRVGED